MSGFRRISIGFIVLIILLCVFGYLFKDGVKEHMKDKFSPLQAEQK